MITYNLIRRVFQATWLTKFSMLHFARCLGFSMVLTIFPITSVHAEQEVARVRVTPLAKLLIEREYSAPATVVSRNDSQIGADISARIIDIPAQVGDIVAAGSTLINLDCRAYNDQLSEARGRLQAAAAELKFAEQQLDRARRLQKRETVSEEVLNQREVQVATTRAEYSIRNIIVQSSERQVTQCAVTAPFRALVIKKLSAVGEWATPGVALLHIIDVDDLEIQAEVNNDIAASLHDATRIALQLSQTEYRLQLRSLVAAVDPAQRTRVARLAINQSNRPLPGASGRLLWSTGDALLPAAFLSRRKGELGVLIAAAGRAQFKVLGEAQEGRATQINLATDTHIITEGRFGLEVGQAIQVVTE